MGIGYEEKGLPGINDIGRPKNYRGRYEKDRRMANNRKTPIMNI
jgi:hypothetical protein